jgi:phage terminase large subunit-like protein
VALVVVVVAVAARAARWRAAPVSGLYAKRRVRHVRVLKKLEGKICSSGVAGAEGQRARSPDRVDAQVRAVDELTARQVPSRAERL